MPTEAMSPVYSFIASVYNNSNSGKGHSWSILNSSLYDALRICVESHFPFQPNDFTKIYKDFRGGYWFGTDASGMGERLYSLACKSGNTTACISFEQFAERKPMIIFGKRLHEDMELSWPDDVAKWESEIMARFEAMEEKRINSKNGIEFLNNMASLPGCRRVYVTRIEADSVNIASYYKDDNEGGWRSGKPTRLQKISRDDIKAVSALYRYLVKASKVVEEAVET